MSDAQRDAALKAIGVAIGEAIREVGEVPSGHLYAMLMGKIGLSAYQSIIGSLVRAGLVKQRADHMLVWVGPLKGAR